MATPELLEIFSRWLEPVRKQIPQDITPEEAEALGQSIAKEAMSRFQDFLKGVQVYQLHPAMREVADDVKVLWQEGTTRLLDYAPGSDGEVVFVIPSLVNRFDILDIDKDKSFLRYLVSEGFRPLVIDWDEPGEEETAFTLSDYMTERLQPLMKVVKAQAGDKPCHMLGYCMGGVFALALAQRHQSDIASLSLMATPWDFAVAGVAGVPPYNTWAGKLFAQSADMWAPHLDKMGCLPAQFLQSVFTTYQPLQILQKYTNFAKMDAAKPSMRRFVLTEDWLNNGVSLSWPVAKECLNAWYKKNMTGELKWELAGELLDPSKLQMPTYILAPQRDRIVPPESALALKDLIPNTTVHEPERGHIGVMASDAAPKEVWVPLCEWLRNRG